MLSGWSDQPPAAAGSSSPVVFVDRPVDDPGVRRPDTSRAQALLDWQPKVTWEEGLAETVAWFREHLATSA